MDPIMPQIKNIVFLMLENRSLDNLLGWLYSNNKPQHFYPANQTAPYDGLIPGRYFNPAYSMGIVKNYPVVPVPQENVNERIPGYDPYEAMREGLGGEWNGVMNQLFGNQDIINRMPSNGTVARMFGFLQDYYARYMLTWQGLDILWCYTVGQLPVINALAMRYAVRPMVLFGADTNQSEPCLFSLRDVLSVARRTRTPLPSSSSMCPRLSTSSPTPGNRGAYTTRTFGKKTNASRSSHSRTYRARRTVKSLPSICSKSERRMGLCLHSPTSSPSGDMGWGRCTSRETITTRRPWYGPVIGFLMKCISHSAKVHSGPTRCS